MTYDELYKKYQALLKENEKLKKENNIYRQQYGPIMDNKQDIMIGDSDNNLHDKDHININNMKENSTKINMNSSPEEKISLFISLFAGRKDVYAHRWESKTGKTGYSPVCTNEWVKSLCEKPKVKCFNCKNRTFAELTESVIKDHLMGNEVIGVYPMLLDETCKFLVIDFDGRDWQKDVTTVRQVCTEKSIPLYVERSRSGKGAHIWFFFEEEIAASIARKFGTAILTYAMDKRHEISFESYDRLFPNQDTMPKGGLGNLIALPLQKLAREEGNSVFINESFIPYNDQWEYLSSIRKIKLSELEKYILDLLSGSELGTFGDYSDEEPWKKKTVQPALSLTDFPESISIIKANMIYIKKDGLSQKILNKIKRLAAFKNPDFYKAQAMRLPTYNKPRIISLSEETGQYLCIPRGCEEKLNSMFEEAETEIEYIDERNTGSAINVQFNGQLREKQKEAVNKLLKYDTGILSATTAFGKTVVGANLISERKVNTLIIVHTRQLLEQWKDRLKEFLIINEELPKTKKKRGRKKGKNIIGQIGGGKNTTNGIIDIALMQSLVKEGEVKELVKDYGMVIVDECHHAASFSYEQILKEVLAKYVYGLTATPIRRDGHHPIIFMCCGDIRYRISPQAQAKKRPFEHFVIPRISSLKMPLIDDSKTTTSINKVFAYVSENQIRNNLIVEDIITNIKTGRNILVLTERTAHVQKLYDMLKSEVNNIFILTGRLSAKKRRETNEKLKNIPESENVLIIATGKYIGEGFDYPRLDTLFLAFPISWKGKLQQYAGRLHRLYEGKRDVYIYDYVDIHIRVLEKMYQKRLKGYASIGYKVKSELQEKDEINIIFDNTNFLNEFISDITAASKEIFIVSPYISKRKTAEMLKLLSGTIQNNIKVTIITRPPEDFTGNQRYNISKLHTMIKATGINLILIEQLYQKFAVIDNRIAWYGDINFLSYGKAQESVMRLNSLEVANELLGSVNTDL
jgi:superfamily II DNA or RNA helicase